MLKNALFFGKKLEKSLQRWALGIHGSAPNPLVGLRRLGARPQTPKLFLLFNLRVTFSTAQMFRHR